MALNINQHRYHTNSIGQDTPKRCTCSSARGIDDVQNALPDASIFQSDNVAQDDTHDSRHATTSNALEDSCSDQLIDILSKTTTEITKSKDSIREEKT